MSSTTDWLDTPGTVSPAQRYLTRQTIPVLILILASGYGINDVSAVPLILSSGSITINTDTLAITGAATASGTLVGGVSTFTFDSISLTGTVGVTLVGSNPLSLRATNGINIDTTLNLSGGNSTASTGGTAILGGGAGGSRVGTAGSTTGFGPGGGGPTLASGGCCGGGGGGGYGGAGGDGAILGGAPGGIYGDALLTTLLGGSGGGGGGSIAGGSSGGGGGGAIELYTEYGNISIGAAGSILAMGGDTFDSRSGGGGSGGAIRLEAGGEIAIDAAALLSVEGGATSGTDRSGGGGGGGRIALFAPDVTLGGASQIPGILTSPLLDADGGLSGGVVGPAATPDGGLDGLLGSVLFSQIDARLAPIPIPEPSTAALLCLGTLFVARRRRRI